jgi:hypothetical protein
MRMLLNDVFGEIEEFKDSDVFQRWLNGDRSFEEEEEGVFGAGRSYHHGYHHDDDDDGRGGDYEEGDLEVSGGGFQNLGNGTAAFGNATSSHTRSSGGTGPPGAAGTMSNASRAPFADLADDDSGWQSAAPYGGGVGGGSQASRQREL